jgi:predicted aldo/keto reductase-like oxidoreductase
MNRRDFLKKSVAASAAAIASGALAPEEVLAGKPSRKGNGLEKRPLGRTGEKLSIIGLGGIVVSGIEQAAANDIVAEALDRGVNYFDVAPTYGNAQERLGIALEGRRDRIFLACKTVKRNAREASAELDQSLKLLKTDRVDLYQLHGLVTLEELEQCFAAGGAMQSILRGKEQGKLRYIGFSAHSVEAALAARDRFAFDSVLFPVNYVLYREANFGPQVVKKAKQKKMGCLALKAMASTVWPPDAKREFGKCWYQPISAPALASLALRFTLSQGVTAAIPPGEERLFRMALDAAERYTPLTRGEKESLLASAEGVKPIFEPVP